MSLGKIKQQLLCGQAPLWRFLARLRGAEVASDAIIIGRPYIRISRGGRLKISKGCKILSGLISNPLSGNNRSALWVMGSEASIELEPGVGCSSVCICAAKQIHIGEGTILGAGCLVVDNDFHLPKGDWGWSDHAAATALPVTIGRGCFIGARAIILKGVTIGDGAVVGAGAVVAGNVPAFHLAAGNPAAVRPLPAKWRRDTDSPSSV